MSNPEWASEQVRMAVLPISVIVCTHNRSALLPKVINELRAQDYPTEAFEIIVIDNNSIDDTPQIVEHFSAEPGVSIRYVSEKRQGITFVRNRGAEEACHPYLAYLDDDCSVMPDWLAQLANGFDLDNNVVAVGGQVVLDWSQHERPPWLGVELEPWLAANSHLGFQPRLLERKIQIMEGNMALKREAWQSAGGFLGMEQFGSQNMSAGEVLYLLQRLRERGGKIAFVPQAVAVHRMGIYTRQRFFQRAYWQGVSDGILDYLVHRRSWPSTICCVIINTTASIILLAYTGFSWIKADQAKCMLYLVRAIRRFSLVLSEMHLAGDWHHVQAWALTHQQV